jgi:hypothetical protein
MHVLETTRDQLFDCLTEILFPWFFVLSRREIEIQNRDGTGDGKLPNQSESERGREGEEERGRERESERARE